MNRVCFHPILVTWFLIVFGDEVTKILRNSLFIFDFHIANGKHCTENHGTKVTKLPKYVMSRAFFLKKKFYHFFHT